MAVTVAHKCIGAATQIVEAENSIFDRIDCGLVNSETVRNMTKRVCAAYEIVSPELYVVSARDYPPIPMGHTRYGVSEWEDEKYAGAIILRGGEPQMRGTTAHEIAHWVTGQLDGMKHGHCTIFMRREIEVARILWPGKPYGEWLQSAFKPLMVTQ